MNHKRGKPKNQRAGCLMCKPNKMNGVNKDVLGHTGWSKLKNTILAKLDLKDSKRIVVRSELKNGQDAGAVPATSTRNILLSAGEIPAYDKNS